MARVASPQLIALLNSSTSFVMADLYTFTLAGGGILRYSAAATSVNVNGFNFPAGPGFERSGIKIEIGVKVDELDL
jgi:hypothetical protein